jgi:hypothetical protein
MPQFVTKTTERLVIITYNSIIAGCLRNLVKNMTIVVQEEELMIFN